MSNATPNTALAERIRQMAAEAAIKNYYLEVADIYHFVAGIPSEITDTYIYFERSFEIVRTGKITAPVPREFEESLSGKLMLLQAVTSITFRHRW